MASLSIAVLLRLALGGLVVPCQSVRVMNYKNKATSVANLETIASSFFKCCKIVEGTIYNSEKDTLYAIRNKKCRLRVYSGTYWGPVPALVSSALQCATGKYPHSDPYLDFRKVETLGSRECQSSPWCNSITEPKCYKITEGELSPWYNGDDPFPQLPRKDFPSGMALSVSGKICQRSDSKSPPMTYTYGPLFAKLKIKAMEQLRQGKCTDEWKQECADECHGLEAAPECDDFSFWKEVLTTEGIKAPNWENTIAAAQASSPEGMAWGKITPDEATNDTMWNARRDTVLKTDDLSSSWS